jgi:uncharacterized protein (TIGR03435 family)
MLITRPDGYHAIGVPIGATILNAYLPMGLQKRELLVDAPAWVWSDNYDVVGSIASEDRAEWMQRRIGQDLMTPNDKLQEMLQPMLRAALVQRCKLAVHRSPGEIQGWALVVVDKKALLRALKQSRPDKLFRTDTMPIPEGGRMVPIQSNENPFLTFHETSMKALAAVLPFGILTPIVDQTGLTGKYDFKLERLATNGYLPDMWDLKTLGLRLVSVKIPIEKIVIDHIEKPSAN